MKKVKVHYGHDSSSDFMVLMENWMNTVNKRLIELETNCLSYSFFLNSFQQLLHFSWALSGKYLLKFFSTATLLLLFSSCQWLWWQCWPIETYKDLLKFLEINLRKSVKKLRKKALYVLTPKSWTINYWKDLVLYCTGLSPFNFVLIRLLL